MRNLCATLTMAAAIAIGTSTIASVPAVNLTTPGNLFDGSSYTLGFSFTVSSPVYVVDLGVFSDGSATLPNEATVGIWTSTGAPRLQVDVPTTGATLIGDFLYAPSYAPYELFPGTTYVVGAYAPGETASSLDVDENGTGSFSPLITIVGDQYGAPGYFVFPSSSEGDLGAWLGANIELSAAPEPTEWVLMLTGIGLLGAALRRRPASARGI